MLKKNPKKKERLSNVAAIVLLFLRSREARGFTSSTLRFYHQNMKWFMDFAKETGLRASELCNVFIED
jgi:hypothetical protein